MPRSKTVHCQDCFASTAGRKFGWNWKTYLNSKFFLLVVAYVAPVQAQSVDRAKMLEEIVSLQNQLKNATDPVQIAMLQGELKAKEILFLQPANEDFVANSASLAQPDTGLIRIMPREGFDGVLSTRGGGAYYSFTRLTNEYGYGSDLSLEQRNFRVGFAGADFGFLVSLGGDDFDAITPDHPGVKYLASFAAPTSEPEAREQYRRSGQGFQENGYFYRYSVAAAVSSTYAVRSVGYGDSDTLVVFRVTRQDTDGSLILLWRLLKWFSTPQLNRGSMANVSAANFKRGVFARESIVSLFGNELSATTAFADKLPLPTSLAGVSVAVFDNSGRGGKYVPLFVVTPNQINYLMPSDVFNGPATITVYRSSGDSFSEDVRIAPVAAGLFTANSDGQGVPAAVTLRIGRGMQIYEPISRFDSGQNKFVATPIDLGPEDDQVFLLLFGTGIRNRSSLDKVSVKIGGVDAPVNYAGAQGGPGLDQLNVAIPRSLKGSGEVEVKLNVDGQSANIVRININ